MIKIRLKKFCREKEVESLDISSVGVACTNACRRLNSDTAIKENYITMLELCKKYNVKAIMAHNARFDVMACNKTLRYITKSKKNLIDFTK